ncbi:phospholipase A2 inhibitor gamma subunit B isoform X5 [Columba livia]|uniref:phospholipase A2 inhibitor gamma subunit B isoform X5 n=1 Tax=Columba livia TaxID=8932 RepID=UPI0031BBAC61
MLVFISKKAQEKAAASHPLSIRGGKQVSRSTSKMLPPKAPSPGWKLRSPCRHGLLCSARLGSSLCLHPVNMKVFLGFSFFLAFLDPVTSLQCEVCHSIGKSCSGPMKTCTGDEDTCGIILHEVMIGGMTIPSSIKTCLSSNICHLGPITMNYGKVKARSHLGCCTGDDCQTISVSLPPDDNMPNGYQCPACYSVDSFQCGNEIVNCTGSETQCVDLAGLMNSGGLSLKAAMKGCTTISECSIVGDGKNNLGVMDIKLRRFQCKQASAVARVYSGSAPPDTLFLPVLSGFILEKLLF